MAHLILTWNALHPAIVHIPIILLLVAPLLVVAGFGMSAATRQLFLESALILMLLGTLTSYVAVATGEIMKAATVAPAIQQILEEHRSLAHLELALFTVLTVVFTALFIFLKLLESEADRSVSSALLAVFMVFYATGAVSMVLTALKGGYLVQLLGGGPPVSCNLPIKEGR